GLYIGVPAIINRQGISKIMTLHLNNVDQHKFDRSCETLKEMIDGELEAIINS
ncbi:MAG: L-lactate dehydrogenase, partial [Faecalibacillus sp.]